MPTTKCWQKAIDTVDKAKQLTNQEVKILGPILKYTSLKQITQICWFVIIKSDLFPRGHSWSHVVSALLCTVQWLSTITNLSLSLTLPSLLAYNFYFMTLQ